MASPMEAINASQTAFPATIHASISSAQTGLMSKVLENTTIFGVIVSLFAMAVAYDQSTNECNGIGDCG